MQFTPMADIPAATKQLYKDLPIHLFSYDDGYYSKKFFSTYREDGAMLRTLMGATSQRMSTSSSVLNVDSIKGVEIKDGPMRYLFGLHADQQLRLGQLVTKSTDDVTAGNIKLQQFFAASMRMAFPSPGRYHVRGVVMMPVSAFQQDPNFKDNVKQMLVGLHQFEAFTGFNDGVPQYEPFEIFVDRILVVEQPLGSLFRVALAPDSGGFDQFINPVGGAVRTTFLDWGMGTFDVFTVDNMKERVDQMCGSTNGGIRVLFDYIRADVLEPLGVKPTPMELEWAIMAGKYQDNRHERFWSAEAQANNGFIDLKPHIDAGVRAMWGTAMQLFDDTIGLTAEGIHHIFITGGPSGWMQPFVIDQFGAHRVHKVMSTPEINLKYPYEHLMNSKDLHLRNAHGGYLYVKSLPQ